MDPEEAVLDVGRALRGLASRMEAYESQQVRIGQVLDSILSRLPTTPAVAEIPPAVVVPLPAMPPAREPRIPPPPRYSGNLQACRGFVTQCQIQFEFQPSQFSCERAKVGYVMSRLEGKPLEWATSLWESQSPLTFDVKEFLQMFRTIFDAPGRVATASSRLLQIRQGSLGASEYARLSAQEKLRRRLSGLCLYCGGQSHLAVSCPVKLGNTPASSKTVVSFAGSIVPKSA
uniref:DUF4939 domain-containing protein n=1 Tax=Xenopus tropicalis TaxID=8364 RepID=A0A803J653_XENTR